jgi:F-type H+-transporting ATPase subunit b
MEKARADIAAAEARAAEYEQRLRDARASIFKRQEARRQKAMQARADAVAKARAETQEQIKQARADIEKDKQDAFTRLQAEAGQLAAEIARVVLQPPTQAGGR